MWHSLHPGREDNLKNPNSGRFLMLPFWPKKKLFRGEIFLNLHFNFHQNTKMGQTMSKNFLCFCFVREIWWLVQESGRLCMFPVDSQIIQESWICTTNESNHIFLWFTCPFQEIITCTTRCYNVCIYKCCSVNAFSKLFSSHKL